MQPNAYHNPELENMNYVYSQPPVYAPYMNAQAPATGIPTQYHQKHKFESALDFLERVKTVFEDQVDVYNSFLDIMKDFKAHTIDTPGVIHRVKILFRGHKDLILGFNAFLPQGFQITPEEIEEVAPTPSVPIAPSIPSIPPVPPAIAAHVLPVMPVQPILPTPPLSSVPVASPVSITETQYNLQPKPTSSVPRKPEFDHARNYVKKIKTRFSGEIHIYQSFLEILHTYHKEQRNIQDVYSQVAKLFKNHNDLLEEFRQFLPDYNAQMTKNEETQSQQQSDIIIPEEHKKGRRLAPRRSTRAHSRTKGTPAGMPGPSTYSLLENFMRIKISLGPQKWSEFVKCLTLYNYNVLSKLELLTLTKDLLGVVQEADAAIGGTSGPASGSEQTVVEGVETISVEGGELREGAAVIPSGGTGTESRKEDYIYNWFREFVGLDSSQPETDETRQSNGAEISNGNDAGVGDDPAYEKDDENEDDLGKESIEVPDKLLLDREETRFDWDRICEWSLRTWITCDWLLQELTDRKTRDDTQPLSVSDYLGEPDRICIQLLYGSSYPNVTGEAILQYLLDHPLLVLPVILQRLQQRHSDWYPYWQQWWFRWCNPMLQVNAEKKFQKLLRSLKKETSSFLADQKTRLKPQNMIEEIDSSGSVVCYCTGHNFFVECRNILHALSNSSLESTSMDKFVGVYESLLDSFFHPSNTKSVLHADATLAILFRFIQCISKMLNILHVHCLRMKLKNSTIDDKSSNDVRNMDNSSIATESTTGEQKTQNSEPTQVKATFNSDSQNEQILPDQQIEPEHKLMPKPQQLTDTNSALYYNSPVLRTSVQTSGDSEFSEASENATQNSASSASTQFTPILSPLVPSNTTPPNSIEDMSIGNISGMETTENISVSTTPTNSFTPKEKSYAEWVDILQKAATKPQNDNDTSANQDTTWKLFTEELGPFAYPVSAAPLIYENFAAFLGTMWDTTEKPSSPSSLLASETAGRLASLYLSQTLDYSCEATKILSENNSKHYVITWSKFDPPQASFEPKPENSLSILKGISSTKILERCMSPFPFYGLTVSLQTSSNENTESNSLDTNKIVNTETN